MCAQGLLHRTVYVLVENSRGEWLLQRRHAAKKIAGGCWDLSAAEHLNPGEAYPLAALRGLQEELGIPPAAVEATLVELLPPSRRSLRVTTAAGVAISDQASTIEHITNCDSPRLYHCSAPAHRLTRQNEHRLTDGFRHVNDRDWEADPLH